MRVYRTRFALALGLFGLLFLIADSAQAGPFRNRRAARNDCGCGGSGGYVSSGGYGYGGYVGSSMYSPSTMVGYGSSGCCGQTLVGYGTSMYYPGTMLGYGQRMYYTVPGAYQGVYQAGYSPGYGGGSGLIPAGGVPGQMPNQATRGQVRQDHRHHLRPEGTEHQPGNDRPLDEQR